MYFKDFMRQTFNGHLTGSTFGGWMEMQHLDSKKSIFIKGVDANHVATNVEIFHFGWSYVQILLEWSTDWWRSFHPGQWTKSKIKFNHPITVKAHMWNCPQGVWTDWVGSNTVRGPFVSNGSYPGDVIYPIRDLAGVYHELEVITLESMWGGKILERYWYARSKNDPSIIFGFVRWDWFEKEGDKWVLKQGGKQLDQIVEGNAIIPDIVHQCKPGVC